jgi:sugar fermentation stimulation protein A
MKFKTRVHEGVFLKRYKRFFADVELNGEIVVAHVANTGSLKGAATPNAPCWISEAENPERKLRYSLEAVKLPSSWVGVNTSWPNQLAKEAFEKKIFSHWRSFDELQAEVKINPESRLDLLLTDSKSKKKHYVEIKNTTLADGDVAAKKGCARFPDAVTERGQKHLRELMKLIDLGHEAEILFTVQRGDCAMFSPADEIDPEYGRLLREAHKKGVVITVAFVDISPTEIRLSGKTLPVQL